MASTDVAPKPRHRCSVGSWAKVRDEQLTDPLKHRRFQKEEEKADEEEETKK